MSPMCRSQIILRCANNFQTITQFSSQSHKSFTSLKFSQNGILTFPQNNICYKSLGTIVTERSAAFSC